MIIACVIMSDRSEPFLKSCLESIYDAVDLVIINDNSGKDIHENINKVGETRLYKEGKIKIVKSSFSGFAGARNICIDYIKKEGFLDCWMLKLDTDEVHSPALKILTRDILPVLHSGINAVDGYYYQFMQSFSYIYSIERRHHMLVRHNPSLRWEGHVHEKLLGLRGRQIALPYVFYHYGYNFSREEVLNKWKLYAKWGDRSFPDLDKVEESSFLGWESRFCFKFPYKHPCAAQEEIDLILEKSASQIEKYEKIINQHNSSFFRRIKIFFRSANYFSRLFFRNMEYTFKLGPSLKISKFRRKLGF